MAGAKKADTSWRFGLGIVVFVVPGSFETGSGKRFY